LHLPPKFAKSVLRCAVLNAHAPLHVSPDINFRSDIRFHDDYDSESDRVLAIKGFDAG